MSNVQLPEPDTHCFDTDTGLDVWSYSKAQLKQYGDDRAREALEMAAKTITATYGGITAVICANLVLKLKEKE